MKGTDGAESINMSSYEAAEDAALLGDVSDIESLSPKVSVLPQGTTHTKQTDGDGLQTVAQGTVSGAECAGDL